MVAAARAEDFPSFAGLPRSSEELAALRDEVRRGAGQRAGVYRMLAADGEVIYVGKSSRVRARQMADLSARAGSVPDRRSQRTPSMRQRSTSP